MKVNVQRMVGLGGLEPPTSPLSEGCIVANKPFSKAFYTIWEIVCPVLVIKKSSGFFLYLFFISFLC